MLCTCACKDTIPSLISFLDSAYNGKYNYVDDFFYCYVGYKAVEFPVEEVEVIGKGATRMVFKTCPSHVLKYPINVEYSSFNLAEIERWIRTPDKIRPYLCPVYDWDDGGEWVLMAYANQLTRREEEELKKEVYKNLPTWLTSSESPYDLHHANWGKVEGKYVMIDYAGYMYPDGCPVPYAGKKTAWPAKI